MLLNTISQRKPQRYSSHCFQNKEHRAEAQVCVHLERAQHSTKTQERHIQNTEHSGKPVHSFLAFATVPFTNLKT